jgi:predicted YcjX-like family ATPase
MYLEQQNIGIFMDGRIPLILLDSIYYVLNFIVLAKPNLNQATVQLVASFRFGRDGILQNVAVSAFKRWMFWASTLKSNDSSKFFFEKNK